MDQQYKPNLIQALTRSPFHPCSALESSSYQLPYGKSTEKNSISRLPNPDLYPYLSRKLASAEFKIKSETSDESLDAVDAATVMLSLKHGPRYRQKREKAMFCQVITTSPSQDHTYSAADSMDPLATDEAFESDDDSRNSKSTCRKIDFEDEEERKIKEGAETLLNLAGFAIKKRRLSDTEYDPYKKIKLSPQFDINENESDVKPIPFKPRMLRTKKKDCKERCMNNNNNDDWVKHRRELEINQHR